MRLEVLDLKCYTARVRIRIQLSHSQARMPWAKERVGVCVCGGGGVRSGGEAGVGVWEGNLWEHL